MNQSDFDSFDFQYGAHTESLKTLVDSGKTELTTILEEVFGHQRAVFRETDSSDERHRRINRYFYEECHIEETLYRGTSEDNAEVPESEFTSLLCHNPNGDNRNNLYFLVGDVGVGKTTFVNSLLSLKLHDSVENKKVWFIRLDIERLYPVGCPKIGDFITAFASKILEVLKECSFLYAANHNIEFSKDTLKKKILERENGSIVELGELVNLIEGIIEEFRKEGRILLLVLDNVDSLCHRLDRRIYDDFNNTGEKPFLLGFCDFVKEFERGRPLGKLGANVLIVTRKDSYRILVKSNVTSMLSRLEATDDSNVFAVGQSDWNEVLESRRKLLNYAESIATLENKEVSFDLIKKYIFGNASGGKTQDGLMLTDYLRGLTNFGLREMVDYYSQYAWLPYELENPDVENYAERFTHQVPVGVIAYILKRKRLFSQDQSRFPNMFLVNKQAKSASDKSHLHPHSYWLKWLILETIWKNRNIEPIRILHIFNHDKEGYKENIVKESLGSLSETSKSNLVFAERDRHSDEDHLQVKRLRLTSRAEFCMKHVFKKFFYLQLVIDDFQLPLPKCVFSELQIAGGGKNDYRYVVEDPSTYQYFAHRMIKDKIYKVALFFVILEVALEVESTYHHAVFAKLKEEGVLPPDMVEWKKSLNKEFQRMADSLGISLRDNPWRKAEKYRDTIEEQILKAFEINYGNV